MRFIALVIQNAKIIRRNLLSFLAYQGVKYFSLFLINGNSVWKEILKIKYVYGHSLIRSSEVFLILRINRPNIFINMHNSEKISYYYCNILKETKFLQQFFCEILIKNVMKLLLMVFNCFRRKERPVNDNSRLPHFRTRPRSSR